MEYIQSLSHIRFVLIKGSAIADRRELNMVNSIYGDLNNETACSFFDDGKIKSCKFEEENIIKTPVGKLIPKYQLSETRTRDKDSVEFYSNGLMKSIYLENVTNIITPIGIIGCEFITFYESGSIHRIFPTFGKVSGTWTEEEEIKLAPIIKIDCGAVSIYNKLSCICFYEKGTIKSITLYTGEKAMVKVNGGEIEARFGIAFYENGSIKSIEPATPTLVNTAIGMVIAFNNDPVGIHGDTNSLEFDESGEVITVTTIQSGIEIIDKYGEILHIAAQRKPSLLDIDVLQMFPIKISIESNGIEITDSNNQKKVFENNKFKFSTFYNMLYIPEACGGNCSSCKGCN